MEGMLLLNTNNRSVLSEEYAKAKQLIFLAKNGNIFLLRPIFVYISM